MTGEITVDDFGCMMAGAATVIRENHKMLSDLDCIAGDGDHGATMLRAVECLERTFACNRPDSLKTALKQAGWDVLGVDGGASSSLLGVFIGGMANSPECDALARTSDLAAIFEAGLAAISKQTKARPGDKTMMDALVPAVTALRTAGTEGKTAIDAMRDAAAAARQGAEDTRNLTARHGRAKLLGERTRGHIDPGAASMSLLFEGFYRGLRAQKEKVAIMPKVEETQVVCVAEFRAKEGKTDELIAAMHPLMEPTHKEPGCIRYELNQRMDDPRWITYIEKWKDKQTFDEHCAMSYITHFFNDVQPDLVDEFAVKLYQEILP